ncbi:MAG: VOC family protein [Polyangiaceae bacterium]|jgi:catechol 2,3-dioxygenase-like lactoylglutathione lyase family enzyme
MNPCPRFGFVVAYVDDIAAAKHFYAEGLGLKVEREAPNFVQFEHFAIATDASMDGKRNLEVYWLVPDAEAASVELSARVPLSMSLRTLAFGKVFGVLDPDRQARYLLELSAIRPSRSTNG